MLIGFLCALVLMGTLLVVRSRIDAATVAKRAWSNTPTRLEVALGALALLATTLPLCRLAPWISGSPNSFWGDTLSHARVAAEIAKYGLPHGWLDSYLGGFPFGHHYPPLGWLLLATGIRAGLSPAASIHLLGWGATLSLPLVFYFSCLRLGARPIYACVGAAFLSWISPYNGFVGGYETFFQLGLISQTLALPVCIWLGARVAGGETRWPLTLATVLAMACHPQVTVAAFILLGVPVMLSGRRDAFLRYVRAAAVAGLTGIALYGQGIQTLKIPFGWPAELGWRQLGFHPTRLRWWLLDGDLLDQKRLPVLTALSGAALLILLIRIRRPAARATALALIVGLGLSVSGSALLGLGAFGAQVLTFLQPLRVVSLIPPVAAAVIVVGLEESAPLLSSALAHLGLPRWARVTPWALSLLALSVVVLALPSRLDYAGKVNEAWHLGNSAAQPPPGYDRDLLGGWLGTLDRGRLWFDDRAETPLRNRFLQDGLALASSVPIATTDGVGAHVGVLWLAFQQLGPNREGSARRAEALGIRHLLQVDDGQDLVGWTARRRQGTVQLLERDGGTDIVGVGCIERRWRGSDAALRARLQADLKTPAGADALLDPGRYTALDYSEAAVPVEEIVTDACNATGAAVEPYPREPGRLIATVVAPHPVDVVFRVAAFPTWQVSIDGNRVDSIQLVAPGFFTIRVPAGRHQITAVVSLLPGYGWMLVLAALAIFALTAVTRRVRPGL